ncbi:MAG: ABC transporter ATP-binding protein [Phycisphaerales bacterium]|nr:ABC transporter ATP-binding protein [Phycisphaerales bacterium]
MPETLLSIENLRVQFGDFVAVDDISFSLRGGDLLGMIGPNGAGKTTTLRAAAGLQLTTTGTISIMGDDVFKYPARVAEHLGFAPDTPAVYPNLSVEDILRFIGYAHGLKKSTIEERIDHWLDALWLTERRKHKIDALSRGMRQRLAVARALLPDPYVILLDEPAGGLDPAGRVQFRQLLASLRDQGKALIVSSHILADLAEYCTHIAIIGHGKLLKFGTVAEVTDEAGGADLATYRVRLATPIGDIQTRMELFGPRVRNVAIMDGQLRFESARDPTSAAALLADMVRAGLPVSSFTQEAADLEQAYLRVGLKQVD